MRIPEVSVELLAWLDEAFGRAAYVAVTSKETCNRDQHMIAVGRLQVYEALTQLHAANKRGGPSVSAKNLYSPAAQTVTAPLST